MCEGCGIKKPDVASMTLPEPMGALELCRKCVMSKEEWVKDAKVPADPARANMRGIGGALPVPPGALLNQRRQGCYHCNNPRHFIRNCPSLRLRQDEAAGRRNVTRFRSQALGQGRGGDVAIEQALRATEKQPTQPATGTMDMQGAKRERRVSPATSGGATEQAREDLWGEESRSCPVKIEDPLAYRGSA